MKHVATVAVSKPNSDKESTSTYDLMSTEPYRTMDMQLSV